MSRASSQQLQRSGRQLAPRAQDTETPLASEAISQSSSEPVVVLNQITKLFGRFAALCDISASFSAGKLYAVLGENGAGKSTLLRIIAGLTRPSQGSLTIFGSEDVRQSLSRIGYMGHAPMLYDELSGAENLKYFGALYSSEAASESNIESAMQMVGLDRKLVRRTSAYSQGMRQRLALARAIVHDPELLLLDEPFSNVDVASTQTMASLLGKLRDRGKTIFVVTHQAEILKATADESVILQDGRLMARTQNTTNALREVTR
jgi:ABC-type multidrug transport system ATPase subunit